MSNPLTGKVTVTVDGIDWQLGLDFNAMCAFEEKTGKNSFEVVQQFESGKISATDLRHLMWAMLVESHPDVTLKQAGDLLSRAPNAIQSALKAATPEADGKKGAGRVKA